MAIQENLRTHTFKTSFGEIPGVEEKGIIKAKNIRYAKSERYQRPVAIKEYSLNSYISQKTPVCPQAPSALVEKMLGSIPIENFEIDESPQYLSVYRPLPITENESLPVVVWIHGGSHEIGCGDLPTSDPSVWIKEQHIIVVSVSFRLGLFGFLGGDKDRPPNLGLFDIIEALRWIKLNIIGFGGDPEKITLLGQSSGGDAIAHLMISDEAEGLFRRAIIQSAPLGLRLGKKKMHAEFLTKTKHLVNEKDVLKMMDQYLDFVPSILKYGLKAVIPFGVQYGFAPLCSEVDSEEKWRQNAEKYDVLIGSNSDETSLYLKTDNRTKKYFKNRIGQNIINKLVKKTTEIIYEKPAARFAENYSKGNGNVYLFRINSQMKDHFLGATHCFDLPMIFANEEAWSSTELLKGLLWEDINEQGKKFRSAWAEFARTGKINPKELPAILDLKKV